MVFSLCMVKLRMVYFMKISSRNEILLFKIVDGQSSAIEAWHGMGTSITHGGGRSLLAYVMYELL